MSTEMESVLRRYIEIQHEENRLKEEKSRLQGVLADHMNNNQQSLWFPVVDGLKLKVSSRTTTSFEYNEELLHKRLGERYSAILAPDIRKIRRNLSAIENALAPVLEIIGSPSQDKVRKSIENGLARKEEFSGAFEKKSRQYISVATMQADKPRTTGT